ncbi:MAG: rRNA maturation RNase YbeY [Clostridia bacterium]|nr:rRNA maturation RNase YbeY [Clostridia bacterium]
MINLKIYFNNLRNPFLRNKISKIFLFALKDKLRKTDRVKKDFYFEVDIKYLKENEIKALNKQYRNNDKSTDVLSFPMIDFKNESMQNYNMLGDIVICKKIAREQSKSFKHGITREICFLALHGFLHLLGYDHIEKGDEKKMNEKAESILKKFKVKR